MNRGSIVQDLGIRSCLGIFQILLVLSYYEHYLPNVSFFKNVYFWGRTCGAGAILLHLAFIREIIPCASQAVFDIYHRAKEESGATVLCAS